VLQERLQALLLLKHMKILYVSQYFPPEMGAPAARASELARYWVKEGHAVTVLTGFPNHPTGVVSAEYRTQFRRLVMRENVGGVNVVRTWLFPFPNGKPYERMLNYSSFCASASTTGMFVSRPDVLIATSPQLLVGLSGWWLARTKRVPFVFEVRDLWPESLAAVGMGNPDSLLIRSLGSVAGFLYKRSEHIVVVTPAFKEYLIQNWRLSPEKISIVKNGVESDLFSPRVNNADLRRELGAEGKFVVGYVGTMGMAHGLETLVLAATELQRTAPDVLFLMVGEGSDKERIINLARSQGLTNIRFVGQQPREKIPEFISISDACLVLLKKSEVFETVIPTKMLEFMSCARPVILGVDGQARRIMDQAGAGVYVEPENAAALVQVITRLAANPMLRETLGRNGRRHIVEHFSRQQTAKNYIGVLEGIVDGKQLRIAA
jgi:colanic acid biosynthesis glycosyl transferase WcaI